MIINFEFKNHRSYRGDSFFTMQRSSLKASKDSIVTKYKDQLSRVAAIYGANASGKSGFLEAINAVSMMVSATERYYGISQFRLNKQDFASESEYKITFVSEGKKYVYAFGCSRKSVAYEELYVYDSQKPALLFRRQRGRKEDIFRFGEKFTSDGIKKIIMSEAKPRETILLLAMLREWHEEVTRPAYGFLTEKIHFLKGDNYLNEYHNVELRIRNDKQFASFINKTLAAVDLGIKSVDVMTPTENVVDKLLKVINANRKTVINREQVKDNFTRVTFEHYGTGGEMLSFDHTDESSGTIAALVFLNLFYDVLRDGSLCLIDEIEASLHPILVAKLVEIFNNKRTNPKGAQLIFTTHDISLIENYSDGEILDRDQIWFVEKNRQGESELYPLTSVQELPRDGSNIGMKYIHGRYGATPDISLFDAILNFERDSEDESV